MQNKVNTNHITMKIRTIFLGILLMSSSYLIGQEAGVTAVASVNRDSILLGNNLTLTVSVEGSEIEDIEINLPDNLQVVSGPNQSSQMMMVNGTVTKTSSLIYIIRPSEVGTDYIPPILVTTPLLTVDTEPIQIDTYPNPTNITQEERLESPFGNQLQFNFDDFFGADFQSLFDQLDLQSMDNFLGPQLKDESPTEENTSKRKLKRI